MLTLIISSFILVFFTHCYPSLAQNSPQDYLEPHNAARSEIGVEPLHWNSTVEAYAIQYAEERSNDCEVIHSQGPYGENIYWGEGEGTMDAKNAVQYWVDEKNIYDYDSNTCMGGQDCLHYTQVVWRNSLSLGCVRSLCPNGRAFHTCNYYPPGNINGEKPY